MSIAVPKNRYLQSLSNIDIAERKKKVITTPTRPPGAVPQKPHRVFSKDLPVAVLFSKPVVESISESTAATTTEKTTRVRRIYEREFLLKFKYTFTDFPPNVPTPEQIVAQYNTEFEARERQAASESSSLFVNKSVKSNLAERAKQDGSAEDALRQVSSIPKGNREKPASGLKLRVPSSNTSGVSRLAMFSSPKLLSAVIPSASHLAQEDKENRESIAVVTASTPVKKVKKISTSTLVHNPLSPFQSVSELVIDSAKVGTVSVVNEVSPDLVTVIDNTKEVPLEELAKKMKAVLREEEPRRLAQRQKQIEYGKNTVGYSNYLAAVPKTKRKREDPKTPNKHQICSKRSWDGQIRKWRRMLHFYDPEGTELKLDDDTDMADADEGAAAAYGEN